MTEAEWLTCTHPVAMFEFLRGKASDRKVRWLAVACCRRVPHLLTDQKTREAVEVTERYADGLTTKSQLLRSHDGYGMETLSWRLTHRSPEIAFSAYWMPAHQLTDGLHPGRVTEVLEEEYRHQSHLVRDIFGNPFRPVSVEPAWLAWSSRTIPRLAQAIYDGRALPEGSLEAIRLAILADALEEAGCTNEAILAHCRQPGEHVRGCWVVDLILGKQ